MTDNDKQNDLGSGSSTDETQGGTRNVPNNPAAQANAEAKKPASKRKSSAKSSQSSDSAPKTATVEVTGQVKSEGSDSKGSAIEKKMLKLIGNDATSMSFNPETNTLATFQGGKYQLSADGKTLRHLMGPAPQAGNEAEAK